MTSDYESKLKTTKLSCLLKEVKCSFRTWNPSQKKDQPKIWRKEWFKMLPQKMDIVRTVKLKLVWTPYIFFSFYNNQLFLFEARVLISFLRIWASNVLILFLFSDLSFFSASLKTNLPYNTYHEFNRELYLKCIAK